MANKLWTRVKLFVYWWRHHQGYVGYSSRWAKTIGYIMKEISKMLRVENFSGRLRHKPKASVKLFFFYGFASQSAIFQLYNDGRQLWSVKTLTNYGTHTMGMLGSSMYRMYPDRVPQCTKATSVSLLSEIRSLTFRQHFWSRVLHATCHATWSLKAVSRWQLSYYCSAPKTSTSKYDKPARAPTSM